MSKDYYKILGVDKNSSQEEIKKAFRKKAHEFHPDKAGGNAEKFKEINEAYQVVGNEEKRKKYIWQQNNTVICLHRFKCGKYCRKKRSPFRQQ